MISLRRERRVPLPGWLVVGLLGAVVLPREGKAQLLGDGPAALPAIHRVAVVEPQAHRLTLGASGGYGYSESFLSEQDQHHRADLNLAVSYRPLSWLAVAYSHQARYDGHQETVVNGDGGWIIEPRFRLRGYWSLPRGFAVGVESALWLPAGDSTAPIGAGTSADVALLSCFRPDSLPLAVALQVGYRIDRSAQAAPQADGLSDADRAFLGVSDSHALLVGLGAAARWGQLGALLEWSWDVLLGDQAPQVTQSPMRVTAGLRFWPIEQLQLHLIADVATSARPPVAPGEALVPLEPRVTVQLGLTTRLALNRVFARLSKRRTFRGMVVGPEGEGVGGAQVVVGQEESRQELETATDGSFEFVGVRGQELSLSISAQGWHPLARQVTLPDEETGPPERFELAPRPGRVLGVVQTPSGGPVVNAQVSLRVGSEEQRALTGSDGHFELTIAPGPGVVTAQAEGYRPGESQVTVERGGAVRATVVVQRALPEGQLRVTVQALRGGPLRARVIIDSLELALETDEEGTLDQGIAPGRYRVRIEAEGYQAQERRVTIAQNGVTLLNINLRPEVQRRRRRRGPRGRRHRR